MSRKVCGCKFSFMANVMNPLLLTHACTGVLVAPNVVVAPASCIEEKKVEFPPVRLGSYNLNSDDVPKEAEVLNTCRRITHKDYQKNNPQKGADIALLILESPAVHHAPISGITSIEECRDPSLNGKGNITAFGWFMPGRNLSPSIQLQAVPNLEVVPAKQCSIAMNHDIPKRAICTVSTARAAISEWDPGSPILCNDKKLIGIASYEQMPNSKYLPYVYTHVAEHWDWIQSLGAGASIDVPDNRTECKAAQAVHSIALKENDDREL
ncbi:unnamed protein product [Ostreobium quekettii]|uniref:Peptidase S1 domain-containing protein n=1 Tax=Ostreobium quekettii TaxID=121088 RepID=A0A8S1J164_9CHLO|nr:unnamed protein product [Ostreobium quekettii]